MNWRKPAAQILVALNILVATSTIARENIIEEVVVSASRTNKPIHAIPNTIKVIDRRALEAQLATSTSLLDSLSFAVPSLTPAHQKMTSNGVTLRGRTPLYMVDGIPQSTPLRNGKRSAFTIDPAFIERIEVIYGANAIQGVGATGGVINYSTLKVPENGCWLRQISTRLTSDNFAKNGFHYKVTGAIGKKQAHRDFIIGVAHDVQDLYYDSRGNSIAVDPIQGDIMDSHSRNIFTKVGLNLAEFQRIEITGNYYDLAGDGDYRLVKGDISEGIPATSESGQAEGDPTYNQALNLSLTYSHDSFFGGELSLQGFYYDFYALYGGGTFPAFQDNNIAPAGTLFDQSALSSEKYGTKLTYVRDHTFWQGLQLATGLDYLRDKTYQELAQTGRLWVPQMIYSGWAPFVQLEQRLKDDRIRVSTGARFENVALQVPSFTTVASANNTFVEGGEPSFEELLGNVGIVFELTEDLAFFASYAEGFTMPDAGLILRGINTASQSIASLIDLQPVVADNLETGANFRRGALDVAASYFWSDSDLGSRILVVDGIGELTRQKTAIQGLEISANYLFSRGVKMGLAYSSLKGHLDSDGDGKLDKDLDGRNIAPDRINLYVEGPLISTSWHGRLQYSKLLSRNFSGGLPAHNFVGYGLVDLMLSYRNEPRGTFTLVIENLFDKQYISYYSQTLTYVNDSSYFAGRGQAISLGWRKDF